MKQLLIALALIALPTLASAQGTPDLVRPLIEDVRGADLPFETNANYVQLDQTGSNQCLAFYVQNGSDYFLPHGFTAANAWYADSYSAEAGRTYTGTFASGSTVSTTGYPMYLPFDFTLPAEMVGYQIKTYRAHNSESATDNTFVFESIDGVKKLNANTPYLIRIEGVAANVISNFITTDTYVPASPVGVVQVNSTPDVAAAAPVQVGASGSETTLTRASATDTNGVKWTIGGTTEKVTAATTGTDVWSKGSYIFGSDGKWYSAKNVGWDIPAFRVFLYPSVAGAVASKGLFGGFVDGNGNDVTGIDNVINGQAENGYIYTIGGQYVGTDLNSLPKGIYILNGKKIIK